MASEKSIWDKKGGALSISCTGSPSRVATLYAFSSRYLLPLYSEVLKRRGAETSRIIPRKVVYDVS